MIAFSLGTYVRGTALLFEFFFYHMVTLTSLPEWMIGYDELMRRLKEEKGSGASEKKKSSLTGQISFSVSNEIRDTYNEAFDKLKSQFRALHRKRRHVPEIERVEKKSKRSDSCMNSACSGGLCTRGSRMFDPILLHSTDGYRFQLMCLVFVRLLSIGTAYAGSLKWTLIASSLQFLLAPYSFFVSFALLVALTPSIYGAHYLVHIPLRYACAWLEQKGVFALFIGADVLPRIHTTPLTILTFLVVDQLCCAYCHLFTRQSIPQGSKKLLVHVLWGFFNCKTVYIVLFLHIWRADVTFSFVPLLLDLAFDLTRKADVLLSRLTSSWANMFYHAHRMGHLPTVYGHAHKLHHYLHGSTSFDAHVYGNGMPEEWCYLWIEILGACLFGVPPATINPRVLYLSWTNKVGHTERTEDVGGCNFHADHHIRHSKNFGIFGGVMDMYFGTAVHNDTYMISDGSSCVWSIQKKVSSSKQGDSSKTTFTFSRKRRAAETPS